MAEKRIIRIGSCEECVDIKDVHGIEGCPLVDNDNVMTWLQDGKIHPDCPLEKEVKK